MHSFIEACQLYSFIYMHKFVIMPRILTISEIMYIMKVLWYHYKYLILEIYESITIPYFTENCYIYFLQTILTINDKCLLLVKDRNAVFTKKCNTLCQIIICLQWYEKLWHKKVLCERGDKYDEPLWGMQDVLPTTSKPKLLYTVNEWSWGHLDTIPDYVVWKTGYKDCIMAFENQIHVFR